MPNLISVSEAALVQNFNNTLATNFQPMVTAGTYNGLLIGTFNVTNSTSVPTTVNPVSNGIVAGAAIVFASQPGIYYVVSAVTNETTGPITLTTAYSGPTISATTATWTSDNGGIYCAFFNNNYNSSDPTSQNWLIGTYNNYTGGVVRVLYGTNGGNGTWIEVGGDITPGYSVPPTCITVDSNDFAWVTMANPTAASFYSYMSPGGSWASPILVGTPFTDFQVVGAITGYSGGDGYVAYASSVGIGHISSTGVLTQYSATTSGPSGTWLLKSNGSIILGIATSQTPVIVWSCTNPATWASTNITSQLTSGDTPSGLAWNSVLKLWLLNCNTAGEQTSFYTSPDGSTWTNTGTVLANLPIIVGGGVGVLSCIGGLWLLTVGPGDSSGIGYLYYSSDGIKWYLSQSVLYQPNIQDGGPVIVSGTLNSLFFAPPIPITIAPTPGVYRFSLSLNGGLPAT